MRKRKEKPSQRRKVIRWVWPLFPVLLVTAVILLQHTVGEANGFVYLTMSLPPQPWSLLLLGCLVPLLVKKRWVWSAVYVIALPCSVVFLWDHKGFHSLEEEPSMLRVMTFNVEKFRGFEPEQVAAVIRKANPDIVCLQEVAPLAEPRLIPKEFHKALPGYKIMQRGETAIASKVPVTFGAVFALRGGEGGRPAQMVTAMVGGQPVSIICVHMQYFPWDGSLSMFQASRNFMKEVSSLEDLVREPGIPTVVAGDFNAVPHGRAHRMLRRYLTDCFAEAGSGFGYTLPARLPLRRLDYIYAGYGLRPVGAWVPNAVASDHRPVVADLVLDLEP